MGLFEKFKEIMTIPDEKFEDEYEEETASAKTEEEPAAKRETSAKLIKSKNTPQNHTETCFWCSQPHRICKLSSSFS